jgi:hypothetical protein
MNRSGDNAHHGEYLLSDHDTSTDTSDDAKESTTISMGLKAPSPSTRKHLPNTLPLVIVLETDSPYR